MRRFFSPNASCLIVITCSHMCQNQIVSDQVLLNTAHEALMFNIYYYLLLIIILINFFIYLIYLVLHAILI